CALSNVPSSQIDPQDCVECYRTEVSEGKLECVGCSDSYPIIGGVPRILSPPLLDESLTAYHADFLDRYGGEFSNLVTLQKRTDRKKAKTLHAFSYQWTTFIENFNYFKGIFLSFVKPFLEPEDFRDRVVLEIGCGSGRPASVASSFGAEVIATDLSEAVQTAQSLTNHYPMLHVVQSDVYTPPFRPYFDFVYSVGVIQHLPDPGLALRSISKVVTPGRRLIVWVYGIREFWYRPIDWLRTITVKMPFRMLHGLSILLAIASEVFLLVPYRILSRIPFTKRLADKIPGHIYANFPFRENVVGWFDRLGAPVTHYFSATDVEYMLARAGFRQIEVMARPGASASWIAQAVRDTTDANVVLGS
ncbi:MAG: class I SAM-dependent methyltransferase, partial [Acidiferrobacterales bacterium]